MRASREKWPLGDYQNLPLVTLDDEQVAHWCGGTLLSGVEDGLGRWVACGGRLDKSGALIELVRHYESPSPDEYEVRCQLGVDKDLVLEELLRELNVKEDKVVWRA